MFTEKGSKLLNPQYATALARAVLQLAQESHWLGAAPGTWAASGGK